MAKGDNTNNPNLRLTPVPSVNGGTVNRLVQVNSEPADVVLAPVEHVVGSDTEFEDKYNELPAPSGESLWSQTEIEGIDNNRVWTVLDGNVIAAGWHFVDRMVGDTSFIVTERPWTDPNEEFWWGQSPTERMGDLLKDAQDKGLHSTTRAYQAREAIEVSDVGWEGYDDLTSAEETVFGAAVEDDEKLLAAVDAVGPLTTEQIPQFGVLLSAKVWQHEKMTEHGLAALDLNNSDAERADHARAAIELNDYNWEGYSELNMDEYLEFDELVDSGAKVLNAVGALRPMAPSQLADFGGLLAKRLWQDSQE